MPDLIIKALEGKDSIEILGNGNQIRHYTYGEDLAKGIVILLKHPNAKNEDFNLSTNESTNVIDLAKLIWEKTRGSDEFKVENVDAFEYDVQKRIPSTEKAKDLLGFEAKTTLSEMLDIVIPWIKEAQKLGYY